MKLSPSARGRDVSVTRISACRVSTDQNQTAAAKDRAVPLAFNSAALAFNSAALAFNSAALADHTTPLSEIARIASGWAVSNPVLPSRGT